LKKTSLVLVAALALATSIAGTAVPANAASCVKIKNAVGGNYQTAQDIWRAQSFAVLPAKDGKGLFRLSWSDKNWKVIAQTPKAGTCVKKNSSVRATIIKYTD
jgi:beta-lactam-binding protein with PASTA domain